MSDTPPDEVRAAARRLIDAADRIDAGESLGSIDYRLASDQRLVARAALDGADQARWAAAWKGAATHERYLRRLSEQLEIVLKAKLWRTAGREAALVAELQSQYESNHSEHCSEWPCEKPHICGWPVPDALRAALAPRQPAGEG